MGFLGTAAISRELDEQWKVLTTLRLVLDPAKMAAADLKRRYADHAALDQAIIDFARDGESDIARSTRVHAAQVAIAVESGRHG